MSTIVRRLADGLQRVMPRWAFLFSYGTWAAAQNAYNLLIRYGLMRSAYAWKSIDRTGSPMPWFSLPAVEYLEGIDLSDFSVLEFGTGFSTVYWSRRAKSVLAIEGDAEWAGRLKPLLGSNARLELVLSAADYPTAFLRSGGLFDVIVIDGASRLECAKASIASLRVGGVIILDDADDYPDASELLRQAGLIEVDFAGFGAINSYTKTTSFFLHRTFCPKPRYAQLPVHSVCHPKRGK